MSAATKRHQTNRHSDMKESDMIIPASSMARTCALAATAALLVALYGQANAGNFKSAQNAAASGVQDTMATKPEPVRRDHRPRCSYRNYGNCQWGGYPVPQGGVSVTNSKHRPR